MTKNRKPLILCLSLISFVWIPGASAETDIQMIKRVQRLRSESLSFQRSGDIKDALNSISEAADAVLDKKYNDPNKIVVESMITAQLNTIQGAAFQKRDWKMAEAALRKKISFMEETKQTENNDYQGSLRFLDIVLRAQNKSTESTLQSKLKPLNAHDEARKIPSLVIQGK